MNRAIMTVTGPIDPDELGVCLTHEHITIDGREMMPAPTTPKELEIYESAMTAQKVGLLRRNPFAVRSNATLDDDEVLADELVGFLEAGGRSIVDVTPICIGRDVRRLRDLSVSTGVQIIAGSAFYIAPFQDPRVRDASVEAITDWFLGEITDGIDDTGVRPGILGELGISMTIQPSEERVLRAAARAQAETGIGISLHVFSHVAGQAVDILEKEGADPSRIVVGHCDGFLDGDHSLDVHRDLARRGCYIAYDTFGLETRVPAGPFAPYPVWGPSDGARIKAVLTMMDDGFADRLLISQDTCQKSQLQTYGGFGYGYIPRIIAPDLVSMGADQHEVDQILIDNPRRLLAF